MELTFPFQTKHVLDCLIYISGIAPKEKACRGRHGLTPLFPSMTVSMEEAAPFFKRIRAPSLKSRVYLLVRQLAFNIQTYLRPYQSKLKAAIPPAEDDRLSHLASQAPL